MAASYTGMVTVTGEGRNGGRIEASDGQLETTLAIPKELGGVDQPTATELADAAHQLCPYSKATHGNIPVTINATAVAA